jgi:outer membrane protein TolC
LINDEVHASQAVVKDALMKPQTKDRIMTASLHAPSRAWSTFRFALLLVMLSLAALTAGGCAPVAQEICRSIILPEQRTIDYRDPAPLPPVRIPEIESPRTVTNSRPETAEWRMSLDDAIRIALENSRVVRVLAGTAAVASGQTIYDAAITNTTVDTAQARFDPTFTQNNLWSRTNSPTATFDPFDFTRALITSQPTDAYESTLGLTKTNLLGGQLGLNYVENPLLFTNVRRGVGPSAFQNTGFSTFPLNPEQIHTLQLSYTQPLLQGAGFAVNTSPIVIARLNTEQSYFQYKDSVQSMVLGVIQAYWNLVLARTDRAVLEKQVELSEATFKYEQARLLTGFGDLSTEAQAEVLYRQFTSSLIAAKANELTQEGALRNILGIPPEDSRQIVPTSRLTTQRLLPEWGALVRLAEQRRPDIVELKIIVEADKERLLQADNQALPQLNAVATYQFNGLSGTMPNGGALSTGPGQFDTWSVGVNFSVPLGLRQGRANVRQQKLLISRDRGNVEQSVHAAIHQLASTVRDLDSAYDQYVVDKKTVAAAERNLWVQDAQVKTGRQVIFLNFRQALSDWGTAVSSEAQQLVSYNVALSMLERETGTILETHGLVFNEERFRAIGPIPCHERLYPEAIVPAGSPHFVPGSDKPAEEAFELNVPEWRKSAPEKVPAPKPDELAPPPRPVPAADQPLPPVPPPDKAVLTPAAAPPPRPTLPEHFPDLLAWPPPAARK